MWTAEAESGGPSSAEPNYKGLHSQHTPCLQDIYAHVLASGESRQPRLVKRQSSVIGAFYLVSLKRRKSRGLQANQAPPVIYDPCCLRCSEASLCKLRDVSGSSSSSPPTFLNIQHALGRQKRKRDRGEEIRRKRRRETASKVHAVQIQKNEVGEEISKNLP